MFMYLIYVNVVIPKNICVLIKEKNKDISQIETMENVDFQPVMTLCIVCIESET